MRKFVRLTIDGIGPRVGALVEDSRVEVLNHDDPLAAIRGEGRVERSLSLAQARLLAPIFAPEIWCAGVTYELSRDARIRESQREMADVYGLVYDADRPELFMKDAQMRRTVGPGDPIRVRRDSSWMVPEPELGLVLDEDGAPVAVTIGNDVSSRDIEGANPLYLPQAKIFAGACAIGPVLAVPDDLEQSFEIHLRITDRGRSLFSGQTSTARMKRSFADLAAWLTRDNPIPAGSVLLTGTGLVPEDGYTLEPGHIVEIEVPGVGTLQNTVQR